MKRFKTPSDAERHYFRRSPSPVLPQPLTKSSVHVQTDHPFPLPQGGVAHEVGSVPGNEIQVKSTATQTDAVDPAELVGDILAELPAHSQLQVASKLFSEYALANCLLTVPEDFLSLAAKAMAQLKQSE